MVPPSQYENIYIGNPAFGPAGDIPLPLDLSDFQENEFEGGLIAVRLNPGVEPLEHRTGTVWANSDIAVWYLPDNSPDSFLAGWLNTFFEPTWSVLILDDDDRTLPGQLVTVTSLTKRAFADAYIKVELLGPEYFDAVPFDGNVTWIDEIFGGAWSAGQDLASLPSFWVANVTVAFQGRIEEDNDPVTEEPTNGEYLTGWLYDGCLVFLETIRDNHEELLASDIPVTDVETFFEQVMAHEIAHAGGADDTSGYHLMDAVEHGRMRSDDPTKIAAERFPPAAIRAMRESVDWAHDQ
jgi:hypothetical protein